MSLSRGQKYNTNWNIRVGSFSIFKYSLLYFLFCFEGFKANILIVLLSLTTEKLNCLIRLLGKWLKWWIIYQSCRLIVGFANRLSLQLSCRRILTFFNWNFALILIVDSIETDKREGGPWHVTKVLNPLLSTAVWLSYMSFCLHWAYLDIYQKICLLIVWQGFQPYFSDRRREKPWHGVTVLSQMNWLF